MTALLSHFSAKADSINSILINGASDATISENGQFKVTVNAIGSYKFVNEANFFLKFPSGLQERGKRDDGEITKIDGQDCFSRSFTFYGRASSLGTYTIEAIADGYYPNWNIIAKKTITVKVVKAPTFKYFLNYNQYFPILNILKETGITINKEKCFAAKEAKRTEITQWGETKESLDVTKYECYVNGLPTYSLEKLDWDQKPYRDYGPHIFKFYGYSFDDQHGLTLKEIRYYWQNSSIDSIRFELFDIERYEYDEKNRIRSITFDNYNGHELDNYQNVNASPMHTCQKDYLRSQLTGVHVIIYKYHEDGHYDVFGCNKSGYTSFHNTVSKDGRFVTSDTKEYGESLGWELNSSGQITSLGQLSTASNGTLEYSEHHTYNSYGDLIATTPEVMIEKEVEEMPWLSEKIPYKRNTFYEYEYDNNGNWTRKKIHKIGGMSAPEDIEYVREITYLRTD